MADEYVNARTVFPPLLDLLAPKLSIELCPMFFVQRIDIKAFALSTTEEKVLDQVRG
ncbi:hypothetical protein PVE_P0112 (plasmid) [Pseudomonas veronii 1YdBTEX2]|uniref:Uncharacterized protein n=1 Tax=Pseudomonas veronii 1YdBTEX2 TaxID=1295141 RepID=A0A1D3KA89_PSEVE|nr:hypothetical protein PVE_P0112 [Pseudomonas veronii 1YdBTEX2]